MARAVHKFGHHPDVDSADVPTDVWDGEVIYPWPTAALTTIADSTSTADTAADGTGARTIKVFGLDADYKEISETVTMNGQTAVTLANKYLRVFRAYVDTAGSGETNAGTVTIQHGATVLAQITATLGQTLMAIYTIPVRWNGAQLLSWYVTIGKTQNLFADVALQTRELGKAWRTRELVSVDNNNNWQYNFVTPYPLRAKTDIRVRVLAISGNDVGVSAGFDIDLGRE